MVKPPFKRDSTRTSLGALRRVGFFVLGILMLGLGAVGAFLPIMPTTIFLIFAAWFFGRSSPRLEAWMLNHPRFGQVLRDWRAYGVMPRRAKVMACAGMVLGYGLLWFTAKPGVGLAVVAGAVLVCCAAYVVTRPERQKTLASGD